MMGHILMSLLFLHFTVHLVSAASHSLQSFYTAVTPGLHFPEFTALAMVDGVVMKYYDSNSEKEGPKTEWMKKVVADDPDYWNQNTQIIKGAQESFKANLATAMKRFNQTEGIHTVQQMYGCEVHDGNKRGYMQYGYDGEDFLTLDMNTLIWTAAKPQAGITKQRWDVSERGAWAAQVKAYVEGACAQYLEKYVEYGRSTLERKVPPKTDLFQKDSSSPVVCHATGFFPKEVMISWQKKGEDLEEDVQLRETLPNQDGTFQKTSILTVSPEELDSDQYTCVIQHVGLGKEIVLHVSDRRVLLGGGSVGLIIGVVVAILLLVIIGCVGVFIWKKKSGFKPVNQTPSEDSASDKS